MSGSIPSRRARYREETRQEAKGLAMQQIADAGPTALSLNAIAKQMGVTGPAMYRYFASRDDLLSELIVDAFVDLADFLEAAQSDSGSLAAAENFRNVLRAVRDWALEQPHRYLLIFGTPVPGFSGSSDATMAARRSMGAIIRAIARLPLGKSSTGHEAALEEQLADRPVPKTSTDHPAGKLMRLGIRCWTRAHGVLSLEVAGHFESMGLDSALFYETEIDDLLWSMR